MARIALTLLVVLVLTGCSSAGSGASQPEGEGPAATATARSSVAGGACQVNHPYKLLPPWASRQGFSGRKPKAPYVLGDNGSIAAVMFLSHHPLAVPQVTGINNKILWIARVGAVDGPLQIKAQLQGGEKTVTRTVAPAPGPSVIDLPSPGCWSFDLAWGNHHDHLMLGYANG